MGRPNTIESHPKKDQLIIALAEGAPLTDLAARYGVSVQALSRYRISRNALILNDELPELHDLVGRAVELADDARKLRGMTAYTSPGVRARLIEVEARVLRELLDRLGVDDATITETLELSRLFMTEVARWARHEPEQTRPLVDRLRHHADEDVRELGAMLAVQL
jgi:transcriptional regulator with XRE-family HTH domain